MNDLEERKPLTEIRFTVPMTAIEVQVQVNRIQEVMKQVMKNGIHYGTIPGCGDKPALLKPGAEKLMMTFRMAVDPVVQDMSTEAVCRYRILAKLISIQSGDFLGQGVGECSSAEEKYAWRRAMEQEFAEADPANRRKKWRRGKQGSSYQEMQVRTNPADVANTILKMAKKRALIDAVLTVTAASDIFNQDIEDIEEEHEAPPVDPGKSLKEKLKEQVAPSVVPPSEAAPESDHSEQSEGSDSPAPDAIWKQRLTEAPDSKSVNAVWRQIPEDLKPDCYATYSTTLKSLKGK